MKPILATDRLKLIPFDTADLNLLYRTLTDSFVREYLMDNEIISNEKAKEFILTNEQSFKNYGWALWKLLLKKENIYAGFAGLWSFFGEEQPQLLYGTVTESNKKGVCYRGFKGCN